MKKNRFIVLQAKEDDFEVLYRVFALGMALSFLNEVRKVLDLETGSMYRIKDGSVILESINCVECGEEVAPPERGTCLKCFSEELERSRFE
jgi:ribosomal protein S27AE